MKLKEATDRQRACGWIVDYDQLKKIQDAANCEVSIEEIDDIIEAMLELGIVSLED